MAAAGFQGRVYSVDVHGFLFHQQGGYRLEHDAEIDVLSVAYASLDAAGMVGMRFNPPVVIVKDVVLFGTLHFQSFESFAVFKRFGGVDA